MTEQIGLTTEVKAELEGFKDRLNMSYSEAILFLIRQENITKSFMANLQMTDSLLTACVKNSEILKRCFDITKELRAHWVATVKRED